MTRRDNKPLSFRLITFPAAATRIPPQSASSCSSSSSSVPGTSGPPTNSFANATIASGILERFQRLNHKRLLTWRSANNDDDDDDDDDDRESQESEPETTDSSESYSSSAWEAASADGEMKSSPQSPPPPANGFPSLSKQLALMYQNCCRPSSASLQGPRADGSGYCQLQVWQCQRRLKFTFTCFILAVHLCFQLWIWFLAVRGKTLWDWPGWQFACASVLSNTLPLTFWLIFDWMRSDSSAAARQAGWLFLYYWACQMVMTLAKVVDKPVVWEIAGVMIPGKFMMTVLAIWWRVSMAEQAFEVRGYARIVASLGLAEFFVIFIKVAQFVQRDHSSYGNIQHYWDNLYKMLALLVIAFVCWRLFTSILSTLNRHPELLDGKQYILSEARWADHALRRVRAALVGLSLVGALANGLQLAALLTFSGSDASQSWMLLFDLPTNMYLMIDFSALLLTVGCFQKQKPGERPSCVKAVSADDLARYASSLKNVEWAQTVVKLALRYITAGELLEFYINLPALMPHFDPDIHTTNDIVRAAIIPASLRRVRYDAFFDGSGASGLGPLRGWAYVEWLDEERVQAIDDGRLFAQRMVTHDWRNLFMHLVAAVLADALGKDEYGVVARDLRSQEGMEQLRMELQSGGSHEIRYWICAFCVNQHKGICGAFPLEPDINSPEYPRYQANRVDTATGEEHQCCSCKEPKYWSGDQCEMNKFDDLMHLLSAEVPDLRQVVAIDRNFELFSRVWCVAELVEAHRSHMKQNVCLLWRQSLDANTGDLGVYLKLATLSVNGCSAAREVDKDRILDKIRTTWGIPEFDAQLQATIFGPRGLLGKELVGFDVIYSAARAALRVKVVEDRP